MPQYIRNLPLYRVTRITAGAMSSGQPRTPFLLIISKPPNALDSKALQLLQAAPDTAKSNVSVAETTSAVLTTPIMQDNTGTQQVRSNPGLPALEVLARAIESFSSAKSKQASQAEQRKRLLESFMTGAARPAPKPAMSMPMPMPAQRTISYPQTPPAAVSYSTPSAPSVAVAYSAPSDPVYFSGQSSIIGSLGTPIGEMFAPKEMQATDIIPRDPPKEVLERMSARTADVLMHQFGALDKRTDMVIDTQIDDRVKGGGESTMITSR